MFRTAHGLQVYNLVRADQVVLPDFVMSLSLFGTSTQCHTSKTQNHVSSDIDNLREQVSTSIMSVQRSRLQACQPRQASGR